MIFPNKKVLNDRLLDYLGEPTVEGYRNNKIDGNTETADDEEYVMVHSVSLCAISLNVYIKKKYL